MSAHDIAEAIGRAQDRRAAADNVHRILDLPVGADLAAGSRARTRISSTRIPVVGAIASF